MGQWHRTLLHQVSQYFWGTFLTCPLTLWSLFFQKNPLYAIEKICKNEYWVLTLNTDCDTQLSLSMFTQYTSIAENCENEFFSGIWLFFFRIFLELLELYQNYMTFWPLASSYLGLSVRRTLFIKKDPWFLFPINHLKIYTVPNEGHNF